MISLFDHARRRFLSGMSFVLGYLSLWPSATADIGTKIQREPFRRVVTGIDQAGRSKIVSDGPVPARARWSWIATDLAKAGLSGNGISGNEVWLFDSVPTDPSSADPLLGRLPGGNQPVPGGIIARVLRYEPGTLYPFHETQTVDVVAVVSGTLELRLNTGATTLRPGDFVVQVETRHSWRVLGPDPCVFVVSMVDAKKR